MIAAAAAATIQKRMKAQQQEQQQNHEEQRGKMRIHMPRKVLCSWLISMYWILNYLI